MKPMHHSSLILPQVRATLPPRSESAQVARDKERALEILMGLRLQLTASTPISSTYKR